MSSNELEKKKKSAMKKSRSKRKYKITHAEEIKGLWKITEMKIRNQTENVNNKITHQEDAKS